MSWTKKDINYLRENVGKLTYDQIGQNIGRSEKAVQCYCLRNRISPVKQVGRNLVVEILTMKFMHPEYFQPTRRFFDAVDINQKRFWDLYYGRAKLTETEYLHLIQHFGVSLVEAFEARQLNLFEE